MDTFLGFEDGDDTMAVVIRDAGTQKDIAGFGPNVEDAPFPRSFGFRPFWFSCRFGDGRRCNPEPQNSLSLTVFFQGVYPPTQAVVRSTVNLVPFVPVQSGPLARPAGYDIGGTFRELFDENNLFEVNADTGEITQTDPTTPLPRDSRYIVSVGFSYAADDAGGFLGEMIMPVTVEGHVDRLPIPDSDAIPAAQLNPGTIYTAPNYRGTEDLHEAAPLSQNLTVMIEEPLPELDRNRIRALRPDAGRGNADDWSVERCRIWPVLKRRCA